MKEGVSEEEGPTRMNLKKGREEKCISKCF